MSSGMRGLRRIATWIAAALTSAPTARAEPFEDPYDLPEAPRPPTLPELTHRDAEATMESTIGVVYPKDAVSGWTRPVGEFVQRANVDVPIGLRRLFAGATYEGMLGVDPSGGGPLRLVSGNVEVYGRTVWATRTGLAFGGGLGLMFPTTVFDADSPAARVVAAGAAARPWDFQFFEKDALTARPFIDVRALDGRFVIQFREGLDWSFVRGSNTRSSLSAITALYVGYRFGDVVGVGLEAFELYFVEGQATDDARAFFAVSPSLRLMTRYVQPCFSWVSTLGDPLYPSSRYAMALRLALTVVWDRTTQSIRSDPHANEHANDAR
jgi:hypothetical protein